MPYIAPYTGEYSAPATPALGRIADYSGADSQIVRGIRSAFQGAKAGLQGFGGMGAELLGADEYARRMYEAAAASEQLAAEQGPRVRAIRQVMESENPLSAGVDYLAGTVGQVTPYLLLGGAGALAGRGLGLAGGLRAGLSGEALAARAASGAGLGSTAAIHPVMAGQQALQLHDDPAATGMGVGERALRANAVGALQGAANALAPAAMVNQAFTRGGPALLPRVLGNMALEGTGEAGEDIVDQLHRTTYDPKYQINPEQTAENFAAGFFGAAPVAGVHGVATNSAHAGIDTAEKGVKALGAGAQWVGDELYKNMAPSAQQALDRLAAGGKAVGEVLDELAPYGNALVASGKLGADAFQKRWDSIDENDPMKAKLAKAYAGVVEGAAKLYTGASMTAEKFGENVVGPMVDDIFGDTQDNETAAPVKAHVAGSKSEGEALKRTADALDNPLSWLQENEEVTPKLLKNLDTLKSNPGFAKKYTTQLLDFVDRVGADTPAAQELRELAATAERGALDKQGMQTLWQKAKLTAEIAATVENLDRLTGFKGAKMEVKGKKGDVELLSRQRDAINLAVREALKTATVDQKFANEIANRIQTRDIMDRGADAVVRAAVTAEFNKRGIQAEANQAFTNMFNKVLDAVNSKMEELGVDREQAAEQTEDVTPDAFKQDVRNIFTSLFQNTEAGREMLKSPELAEKQITGLSEYIDKLATGELKESAATKLRSVLTRLFGKEADAAVDRLIDAAAVAYGGLGDKHAESVHALVNSKRTLPERRVAVFKAMRYEPEPKERGGVLLELVDDVEAAHEFDARRSELPATIRKMAARLKQLEPGTDAHYRLGVQLSKLKEEGALSEKSSGYNALKAKWVDKGIVTPKKFEALYSAVEAYAGNPDRLANGTKQNIDGHEGSAGRLAEDQRWLDGENQDDRDPEAPITQQDVDDKRDGESYQTYLQERFEAKYGAQSDNTVAPPIYFGSKNRDLGAPVSKYAAGDKSQSGRPTDAYSKMVEDAHSLYSNRAARGRGVRVAEWADEQAQAGNKNAQEYQNDAMKALLEHDQERLAKDEQAREDIKNGKNKDYPLLTEEDKRWIENRAKLAARLEGQPSAGEQFFAHPMNRHYRYYRMEADNGGLISYSAEQLALSAPKELRGSFSSASRRAAAEAAYIERRMNGDGNVFDESAYKDGLLVLQDTEGNDLVVDVPDLVRRELGRHQASETTGAGEKKRERNHGEELLTAARNVLAALMTADGIDPSNIAGDRGLYTDNKGGKFSDKKLAKAGDENFRLDPNLVIYRDPKGAVKQEGEHVLEHSVQRVFRLKDLDKIVGIDFETMKAQIREQAGAGPLTPDELGRIAVPQTRGDKRLTGVRAEERAAEKAALGVAAGAMTKDGKPVDVDLHQLLATKLNSAGIDAHSALRQNSLPKKLAATLLRDGLMALKAAGYEGPLFDVLNGAMTIDSKFDNVVVYQRAYDDEAYDVTMKDLRNLIINPDVKAPRNLRDAKVQEAVEALRAAEKKASEFAKAKRSMSDERLDLATTAAAEKSLNTKVDVENRRTAFEYGQPTNQDVSGAKIVARRDENGNVYHEREQGDTPKYALDESENMHIQQVLKELGEMAQGDTPLFDRTEAFGTQGGKEWKRQQRPSNREEFVEDFEGPRDSEGRIAARDEMTDSAAQLKEALRLVAAKDPEAAAFFEKTYDLNDKDFGEFMEKRAAWRNDKARRQNAKGTVEVKPGERSKPLSLKEQKANAKLGVQVLDKGLGERMNQTRSNARTEAKAALVDEETAHVAAPRKSTPEPEASKTVEEPAQTKIEVDLNKPAKSPSAAVQLMNSLSDAQAREVLDSLGGTTTADGTVGYQLKRVLKMPTMQDWADKLRARAGVGDVPFSRQRTVEKPAAGAPSLEQLRAEHERLVGESKIAVEMPNLVTDEKGESVSGKYDAQLKKILVSALSADRMQTLHHETWHHIEQLLGEMGENGQRVLDEVTEYANSDEARKWLAGRYSDDEGVMSQLASPKERAAYLFQSFMQGDKPPAPEAVTGLFGKIKAWVKRMAAKLGFETTTNTERAENFFSYVQRGEFARDVENAISVRKGMGEKNGDNVMRLAAKTMKPVMEGLEKVLQHTSERVHKLGIPEYSQVVEMFSGVSGKGGMYINIERNNNKFGNMVASALGDKTVDERVAFVKAHGMKPILRAVEKYLKEAGVEPHTINKLAENLDAFNSDKINDDIEDFITDLVRHGGFKGKAGEARQIANDIARRGYYFNPDQKLFADAPEIAKKWMERDPLERNLRFVERAVHLAENTRTFGQKKEYTSPTGEKYWQEEKLHDLLAAGDSKADKDGQQLVRDYISAMRGEYGGRLSPGLRKLQGGVMFALNVNALPLAVFAQMLEPLQLGLRRNRLGGSLDSLFRGILDLPRTFDAVNKRVAPDYWEKLAYQTGTAPLRIVRGTMTRLMNGDHIGGKVGEWNERFFKYNFMDQWNRTMHIEATRHAVEFLKENARGENGEHSERFLAELGLTKGEVLKAIKTVTDNGKQYETLELSDKIEQAIATFVDEAMAHPDSGSNPLWMNDPRFALMAQMRRFTFAHSKYVLDRGMKEMKLGNMFPVAPALIAMPWMMAADGLRDVLSGKAGYQSKSALDYAMHAMERANHFGRAQVGLDALNAVGRGGSPVENLLGPTAEMFGDIARSAHNGRLTNAVLEYTPGGDIVQMVM